MRQQINVNTAFIDGSQVYGSDDARARELRTLDGTGQLRTSGADNMLPFNVNGFPNQPNTKSIFFLAGDVRANENGDLTALQILFMREHNFWAARFKASDPGLDDDGVYYRARAMVGAEIEKISIQDFLVNLIGKSNFPAYTGYKELVNPAISNVFAAAAYRFGHSLLNLTISRLDANNRSIGDLALQDTFFHPAQVTAVGIEPYLRGMALQRSEEIDAFIVDQVRNHIRTGGGGSIWLPLTSSAAATMGCPTLIRFGWIMVCLP